ncbi:MAG TPA: FAD-dependent monooxygenase [Polyangiaceae bacterium]|nr:FAD-dependent monooxygenase [Polyangiaceae bacterium]
MIAEKAPVLVVGGSLVGLSTALFLSFHGVKVVLVEPHLASHPHPRAVGFTTRTLEILHLAGIELPATPSGFSLRRARVESLEGQWFEDAGWTPKPQPKGEWSPFLGAGIPQDQLEPRLRDGARRRGADLRLGTELVRFEQDDGGVTGWLKENGGREYELRAAYLVACDGNGSAVREALGILRKGPGALQTLRSVLFRAPIDHYLEKKVHQFEIDQPDLQAFLTTYNDGRWVLMFKDDAERTEAQMTADIKKAIGKDVPVEIITTGRWDLTALIATQFSKGRVFLAGDAAHTLPPTRGGYGANTGIHDAHNLSWKIAAVLRGEIGPDLLDTYDVERRPAAWTRLEQTFARPDYARHARGVADGVAILDEVAIELGQLYRNLANDEALPEAARPDEWKGQPGTRAPHLWLPDPVDADERVSTLDWFGRGWVLVTAGGNWVADAGIHIVRAPENVREAFGLAANGASLVRPDGVIAWRKTAPDGIVTFRG